MRKQQIEDIVWKELERAMKIRALHYWVIPYDGLEFSKSKRTYGQATRQGKIRISVIFLGTREFSQLKDTIRHEIAHLMCGMEAGHNANWRHAAVLLGCRPRASTPISGELVKTARKKWRLIGVLESGKEVAFMASHVKQGKYLRPDHGYTYQGTKIDKFKYVRNV